MIYQNRTGAGKPSAISLFDQSDQLVRVYLDELPPALPDQFELAILELIAAKPDAALARPRQ